LPFRWIFYFTCRILLTEPRRKAASVLEEEIRIRMAKEMDGGENCFLAHRGLLCLTRETLQEGQEGDF